jgi:hypothetical protein
VPENPRDVRLRLADRLDLDGDHDLAKTVRWCAENHPDDCDLCYWLTEDFDLPLEPLT